MLVGGCATGAQPGPSQKERALVLLTQSPFDEKIRSTLSRRGFTVLDRAPAVRADARYGLSARFGPVVDSCVFNNSEKYAYVVYEVSDLETRSAVATVKEAGWTGPCLVHWPEVFDDLADQLLDQLSAVGGDRAAR